MEIFDVRCSRCGRQLYFIETTDEEERGLIFATSCQNCAGSATEQGLDNELSFELQKELRPSLGRRLRKALEPEFARYAANL